MQFIRDNCQNLKVLGLMTIGQYDNYNPVEGINPDFRALINCRNKVSQDIGINPDEFELSMGMSADYEHAVSNYTALCNL